MNTKDILIDLVENKGVQITFIARKSGITRTYIHEYISGNKNWGKKTNKKFLDFYESTYK